MNSYNNFLMKKPLFNNDKIDYARMPKLWKRISSYFTIPKIIHIVGTNGKGTTGRFISWYLYKIGLKVGHYSSPHILNFNERIWLNGKNIDDDYLAQAHVYLQKILTSQELSEISYFEYTTLMAIYLFQKCDYIVLEAGLGGEFDATNIFEKKLTLVAHIDYDHQELLGESIDLIACTKMRSITKDAILGFQKHKEVLNCAKKLQKIKQVNIFSYKDFLSEKDNIFIDKYILAKKLPLFFRENLSLALSALKFFNFKIDMQKFNDLEFFGRCQKIRDNVIVDVGHNILAANALRKYFSAKKIILIYNSYKDKDFCKILSILKPIIKNVEILPIDKQRIISREVLQKCLNKLDIEYKTFSKIKNDEEYLVFGSFSVVEEFLRKHNEK